MSHIKSPTHIKASGNLPKIIKEYVGKVNSNTGNLSLAVMESPEGWEEPGQTPDFDEYTFVIEGALNVETKEQSFEVKKDEAFVAPKGKWVKYSTPLTGGAKYISVCQPAFSPETVHRDSA